MNRRLCGMFLAAVVVAGLVDGLACSRRTRATGAASGPAGEGPAHGAVPGDADCYKVAGARPCPPDNHDPSGKNLPSPGAVCSLGDCAVCGSATVPAFRDFNGVARPGWCICVETSGGPGWIYSCFGTDEWQKR